MLFFFLIIDKSCLAYNDGLFIIKNKFKYFFFRIQKKYNFPNDSRIRSGERNLLGRKGHARGQGHDRRADTLGGD